nr:isocitrate lyase/phosphoenolpyruvate mutase family protein [Kibdelosporangium sp. MJ126-NF4]CEL18020.1 Phosphoenolpyruvate phosphomutase [Kibdelosporangium sp. MJ126-NF4]CTQ90752.1 Phosphoenolpyruvate phosphomutase (EC 5.4.2.9) [Kibdelosporangium sp. MJ126-NF4]
MTKPSKAAILRSLLADDDLLVRAVGAHNGLGARLAEQAGFEAVWASGFEMSASYAVPDASLLTMTQYLDGAEAMDVASALPVIADCDTGFGGPLNVAHMVRSYERRGVAAVCVEDKVFPKMNSFAAAAHDLVPIEEFCLKIKAGKAAQESEEFVLIARTEGLVAGVGMEETLRRARAYAGAGADAILVHSKSRQPAEVLEFAGRWDRPTPLVSVPTTYDGVHERDLLGAGFRIVIYANQGVRAAIRGMSAALARLADEGNARSVADEIAPMAEVFALQRMTAAYETKA